MERLRRWWWHYRAADYARLERKDREVEVIRARAIAVRKVAEVTRSEIMRGSFSRANARLARR